MGEWGEGEGGAARPKESHSEGPCCFAHGLLANVSLHLLLGPRRQSHRKGLRVSCISVARSLHEPFPNVVVVVVVVSCGWVALTRHVCKLVQGKGGP